MAASRQLMRAIIACSSLLLPASLRLLLLPRLQLQLQL